VGAPVQKQNKNGFLTSLEIPAPRTI